MDYTMTAPALNEAGAGCWNVWLDDAIYPETFSSYGEALTFAERMDAEGHRVETDFD